MKGLYISLSDMNSDISKGAKRKIKGQIKSLKKFSDEVDWIYNEGISTTYCNGKKIFETETGNSQTVKSNIDFKKLDKYIDLGKYDYIYIRYIIANLGMLSFLKKAKSKGIKVIIEIPTYPYLEELDNSLKMRIYKLIDNHVTKRLHKWVYRIACTNKDDKIFNIDTIKIDNGVDLDNVSVVNRKNRKEDNYVNFIGVASIDRWHGYDRFIEAINVYNHNNKANIKFYIVGGGNPKVIESLKLLVEKNKLEKNVIFTGAKDGEELENLYDNMDVGVSSLALFRAGSGHNPIKTKEYIAKGLPVVTGYEDSLVPSNLEFICKVEDDESIFNLKGILKWYNDKEFNEQSIRKYAMENVSWDVQMKKVIKEIEKV
ncbi:glycosyltransferase [Clostridium psychrophilum]|uniref:glycosyltransferase n=1 Tax=Clostridium psychrophilum TaxID=132926 RepID=UPI001C0D8D92|nr:glycosyltransferase [Clostridium psychrophilum]MBU3180721.1 glycosyltransferase [Clostridium psychrophilum]